MTFGEYCNCQKDHTFTSGRVIEILEKCGYHYKIINTLVAPGQCTWRGSGMKEADAQTKIREMYEGEISFYFTYIKFYEREGQRFALVAGKTNLFSPDFYFGKKCTTKRGDEAKKLLNDNGWCWYCQQVLAVWEPGQELWEGPEDIRKKRRWGPQARRALAVEKKIRDLLGLFSS